MEELSHLISGPPREMLSGDNFQNYVQQLTGITDESLNDPVIAYEVKRVLATRHQMARITGRVKRLAFWKSGLVYRLKVLADMRNVINRAVTQTISLDLVPCVVLNFWPRVAIEWLTRDRQWPDRIVVDNIASLGVHAVRKPFRQTDDDYRLSFSIAEICLTDMWTAQQRYIYFVFKSIFCSFVRTAQTHDKCDSVEDNEETSYVFSYIAKTIMFHVCEGFLQSWWSEENALGCLTVLFHALLSAYETRNLSHYFILSVNLLQGIPEKVANKVVEALEAVLKDPESASRQLEKHFVVVESFLRIVAAVLAVIVVFFIAPVTCLIVIEAERQKTSRTATGHSTSKTLLYSRLLEC